MKKNSTNFVMNFSIIIIFTVLSIVFALKDDYQNIATLITNISKIWFFIIISWGVLYTCIIGVIYYILGKRFKHDYTFLEAIEIAFIGSFFAGITPSATGGQVGQAYVMKKQKISMSNAASILWADFIIYQSTMMIYVTFMFFFYFSDLFEKNSVFFTLVLIGYLINIIIILILWTMAFFPKFYIRISRRFVELLYKIRIVKNKDEMLCSWNKQLQDFTKEIKLFYKEKVLVSKLILINVLRLTMLYSLPFVVCYAMGDALDIRQLFTVIALSSFVTIANTFIPIPGASGGTEWAFVLLFSSLMNSTLAKSVMLLWRFSTYHFVMIVGGLFFLYVKKKYHVKNILHQ